jgi:hypothetical protein
LKKALPYILAGIIIGAAALLIFTADNNNKRVLNERVSFRKHDKIPYGGYVAYQGLKSLFPAAKISSNTKAPGDWDSLSNYSERQALIIVAPYFYADEFEMKKLISFVENGNDVFISAAIVSEDAKDILDVGISYLDIYDLYDSRSIEEDTLVVSLMKPPFERTYDYMYPGKKLDCHFFRVDSTTTTVLGRSNLGSANFVHLKAGAGNLYLHLAPMAFSNYFLLSGKNKGYYEDVLSVISPTSKKIVWDEYYLTKRTTQQDPNEAKKGWLSTLLSAENAAGKKSFAAGFWILVLLLLLYVLMEMRRKQRYIPVIRKPANDSLDFVKTIGRLYFDKGDHKNLSRKMSAYFLEHVRNRYKLATHELNEEFIQNLKFKSGVNEEELRSIVFFIRDIDMHPIITAHQLAYFHKQLESFYSKT